MSIDYQELDHRFTAHSDDQETIDRMEHIREAMRTAAVRVCEVTPQGRERALALTKLEEAMFWANAGIAREES